MVYCVGGVHEVVVKCGGLGIHLSFVVAVLISSVHASG